MSEGGQIRVVLSDRWEDVRTTLRVVYDGYLDVGYAAPTPSGMRFIAPYLNKGTAFIHAELDGVPAASGVLIRDGAFGLPSERAYAEEIDQLRAGPLPLVEYTSLVVAPWARHATRSLFSFVVAAGVRVMSESGPCQPLISVEPGNERFYTTLFGASLVGEERPLYGAPAILVSTPLAQMHQHLRQARGALTRHMASLVFGQDDWREDRRAGAPWPQDELAAVIGEQGVLRRFGDQLGLLRDTHPQLLAAVGA